MDVVDFTQELIREASVTPHDARCQQLIAARLQPLEFAITSYPFGEVTNLWARRGNTAPLFVFAGHTDVVPTGPLEDWTYPPYDATIFNETLYGRGAADMKGGIAAMVCAVERFVTAHPKHPGTFAV